MNAIVITYPGGPEVLQIQQRPMPLVSATEVLVKVAAAGVNRPDVFQRKGNYPPPPGASADIPGLEVAGTIIQTGSEVTRWKTGNTICALLNGGGYAEYCAVPAGQCLPVPPGLSLTEAASLPETFFTVWNNVFDRAKLQKDESLLVHGGSGGIGVAAIQMAKAMGSTVYATAGNPAKLMLCEQLGAERAINYNTENFTEVISRLTQGKGVDVILDMIAGGYTTGNINSLANNGRLVLINTVKGKNVQIDLSEVMRKQIVITGSMLRPRGAQFKTDIARKLEQYIWPLLASGQIKPVVYKTFRAEQVQAAHTLMESNKHMGKIVLTFK